MNYSKTFTRIFIILFLCIVSSCNIEPFEGEIPEGSNPAPDNCGEALEDTADASAAFSMVTPSDSNYSELCTAYKNALKNQIALCGDEGGLIQIIIDGIGDCGDSGSGGSVADGHAFMTANIIGEQFDDMKPNGYVLFKSATSVVKFFGSEENYIRIQGNSNYSSFTTFDDSKEINLYIPESLWLLGTYDLNIDSTGPDNKPTPFFNIIYDTGSEYPQAFEKEGGTITITEFDLANRVIKGAFEFPFIRVSNTTSEEIGPFDCKNGTFDYSLDDEYFD